MTPLSTFLHPFKSHPWYFIRGVLVNIAFSSFLIFTVWFSSAMQKALSAHDAVLLQSLLWQFSAVVLVYQVITIFWRHWGITQLRPKYLNITQNFTVRSFLMLPTERFESHGTGKLLSLMLRGTMAWSDLYLIAMYELPKVIITLVTIGVALWAFSWELGLGFMSLFMIMMFAAYTLMIRSRVPRTARVAKETEIHARLTRLLMSRFSVLQNRMFHHESAQIDEAYDIYAKHDHAYNNYLFTAFALPGIFSFIMLVVLYGYFANDALIQSVSVSFIAGIASLILLFQQTISSLVWIFREYMKNRDAFTALFTIFSEWTIQNYDTGETFVHESWDIEFQNVNFAYTQGKEVFSNISFKLAWGKRTALIGHSGAGKSTIMKLLLRSLEPVSGQVLVDGQNIATLSLASYYSAIGYLSQDPQVFDGSILENLMYGLAKAPTKIELETAIKHAQADFIFSLTNGLDTQIGERGVRLSGWERQRLAIARIFLQNPKILPLDEPTSALDSFSEHMVSLALHELFKDRTVIIIAHRLQTVKEADRILVIESGKIIEDGTHETLLAQGGNYASMVDLQSGWVRE